MEVYLVGGAVRDELLGLNAQERDWVVVGATPEQMLAKGYKQVGKDFPVFIHPETHEEYALARTERKKGRGYYGFEIHASPDVTLEEDLQRRDLTINAMAKNKNGDLIDPYGGKKDLDKKLLRHVSNAFSEDPLRVLRVARFAAKFSTHGFTVAEETQTLMKKMVESGELTELASERIWQETHTALQTSSPNVFFEILHNIKALEQTHTAISSAFSTQTEYNQSLLAIKEMSSHEADPCMRFAALIGGLYLGLESTAEQSVRELCEQLTVPNACKELLTHTVQLQSQCHKAESLNANQLLELLNSLDVRRKPDRFEKLLRVFAVTYQVLTNEKDFPQENFLESAANVIDEINVQDIAIENNQNGSIADIKKQLQLEKLKSFLHDA